MNHPIPRLSNEDAQRFARKFSFTAEGCWQWPPRSNPATYGVFSIKGKMYQSARVAYSHHRGPIPDGMVLHHLCRNHNCVNPAHLEPVARHETWGRGVPVRMVPGRAAAALVAWSVAVVAEGQRAEAGPA